VPANAVKQEVQILNKEVRVNLDEWEKNGKLEWIKIRK
jgi:hypothetical protein